MIKQPGHGSQHVASSSSMVVQKHLLLLHFLPSYQLRKLTVCKISRQLLKQILCIGKIKGNVFL